ncbi:hypothetical protein TWF281_002188 [Arthrobotrys megalospora]
MSPPGGDIKPSESHNLELERSQQIVKFMLPTSVLKNLEDSSSSSNTETTTIPNSTMATSSGDTVSAPIPSADNKIDQETLKVLNSITIHALWAKSVGIKIPEAECYSGSQSRRWIEHLELKGRKFIGSLLKVGMEKSTEALQSEILKRLKGRPNNLDSYHSVRKSVSCVKWENVEQLIADARMDMLFDLAADPLPSGEAEIPEPRTVENSAIPPASENLIASTVSPEGKLSAQSQSSETKKRKFKDFNSPPPPGKTWWNLESTSSSRVNEHLHIQPDRLRQGSFRNKRYSVSEISGTSEEESEEEYDEESEENDVTSGEDIDSAAEYEQSEDSHEEYEDESSEDYDTDINKPAEDSRPDEDEDEEELPPLKRPKSPEREEGRKLLPETGEDGIHDQLYSCPSNVIYNADTQQFNPTEEPVAAPEADASSTKGTMPKQPETKCQSTETVAASASPDQDRVYFSTGIGTQNILTEFKAMRNLAKQAYDVSKSVDKRFDWLVKDKDVNEKKYDKVAQDVSEIKESLKMLFAWCKGQNL